MGTLRDNRTFLPYLKHGDEKLHHLSGTFPIVTFQKIIGVLDLHSKLGGVRGPLNDKITIVYIVLSLVKNELPFFTCHIRRLLYESDITPAHRLIATAEMHRQHLTVAPNELRGDFSKVYASFFFVFFILFPKFKLIFIYNNFGLFHRLIMNGIIQKSGKYWICRKLSRHFKSSSLQMISRCSKKLKKA